MIFVSTIKVVIRWQISCLLWIKCLYIYIKNSKFMPKYQKQACLPRLLYVTDRQNNDYAWSIKFRLTINYEEHPIVLKFDSHYLYLVHGEAALESGRVVIDSCLNFLLSLPRFTYGIFVFFKSVHPLNIVVLHVYPLRRSMFAYLYTHTHTYIWLNLFVLNGFDFKGRKG